ncbi:MAG: alpha-L-fucosidase, partial [Lachnospiraceae bacterium]|nr:alpha-L-fucosidase [Lachnospiraceae bacterium]
WRQSSEGPTRIQEGQFTENEDRNYTEKDIRFTVNHGCLYAAVMKYPADGSVTIESLGKLSQFCGMIRDVSVLGFDERPAFSRDDKGLHIHTESVRSEYPVVLKIVMD